ncbi:MAG: transposase [Bacteroidia bacterium]|nr:transposase [Bacteroidia bacterium]
MPDHIHIFMDMRPDQSVSDLLQEIKSASSRWINECKKVKGKFEWQSGYGGFSYRKSDVPQIINYINNQKKHHSKKSFLQEYKEWLEEFEVEYDERYIFHEPI